MWTVVLKKFTIYSQLNNFLTVIEKIWKDSCEALHVFSKVFVVWKYYVMILQRCHKSCRYSKIEIRNETWILSEFFNTSSLGLGAENSSSAAKRKWLISQPPKVASSENKLCKLLVLGKSGKLLYHIFSFLASN